MQNTKEVKGADVLNNAFNTNFTGGDGVTLINTAHPLAGGGTAANRATTMADLNETSLEDALIDIKLPFIEVHLSNPHARESWRHDSVFTEVARGQITGFGYRSYTAALEILTALVEEEST